MSRRLTPLYVFDDAAEYHHRHTQGTLVEFQNESREVESFNARQTPFKTWVVAKVGQGKERSFWVFLVRPGDAADWCFPKEGEACEIMMLSKGGKEKRSKWWDAERVDNPAASMGLPEEAHRLAAFEVKVPNDIPENLLRPIQDDPDHAHHDPDFQKKQKYVMSDKKATKINIKLSISAATKDAELGAMNKLFSNPKNDCTEKQNAAFRYLLDFKNPRSTVNMFNHFPHLRDPMNNPRGMPQKIIKMLEGFNEHQIVAYRNVLSSLPCGVCIIPGGPGAGKTHWNLVLTAAIQSKDVFWYDPDKASRRPAKVLYIVDINKPLDDTSNKIVKLYKSLGLKKFAVRLCGWHYKKTETGAVDFTSKFMFTARLNRYRRQKFNPTCLAPTLDELAWDIYDANKTTKYSQLYSLLTKALKRGSEAKSEEFRENVNELYRNVLDRVDFIATTPVPAATRFDGLFKPDIVIFDESPHAREASTMVAIAQFEPIAWIFSGDHRQTRPFVASDDVRDNPWAPQMLVSMMERADRAGAITHSLLINHRAHGGLQRLASGLFYGGKMISGHQENELIPPSVQHLQRFLGRFMDPGCKCGEPRLIVSSHSRGEVRVGTSWFNVDHMDWVMERVGELLPDPLFQQVGNTDRGTILIIAPYKEAYMKYKKAIKDLPKAWAARLGVERRLQARTIDTVQGGEADFVFLDLVRSQATDFTDDPNRLCVALTRACQAEVVLMHPGMCRGTMHLSRVYAHCERMGQVVTTDRRPRPIASVSTGKGKMEPNVTFGPQVESKLTGSRLEWNTTGPEVSNTGGLSLADRQEPETIFASQFAEMAAFMEDMLEEEKRKRTLKKGSAQGHPQDSHVGAISQSTKPSPSPPPPAVYQPPQNGCFRLRNEDRRSPAIFDKEHASTSKNTGNNAVLTDDVCGPKGHGYNTVPGSGRRNDDSSKTNLVFAGLKPGLASSRWNSAEEETPSATELVERPHLFEEPRPSGTVPSEEMCGAETGKKAGSLPTGQSWW